MPLTKKRIGQLREMLENERDSILAQVKGVAGQPASNHGDLGDLSSSEWNSELLWELEEHERERLIEIDGALERMEEGTYGICEICEKPIPFERLKVMPTARYTVDCQEELDRKEGRMVR